MSLTQRQRDVAELIAAGTSTATVAAVLGLSVRTVSGHLRVIYPRLGITSRHQLAEALTRLDAA